MKLVALRLAIKINSNPNYKSGVYKWEKRKEEEKKKKRKKIILGRNYQVCC